MRDSPAPGTATGRFGQRSSDSALARALTELYVQDGAHDRDAIRRFEELALHLIPRVSPGDRQFIAELLAARVDAPVSVIAMLARDTVEIARPLLSLSPVLDSRHLLAIVAATGPDHHALIAERSDLDGIVRGALRLVGAAKTGDAATDAEATDAPDEPAEAALPDDGIAPPTPPGDRFDPWRFLTWQRAERLALIAGIAEREIDDAPPRRDRAADQAFRATVGAARLAAHARVANRPEIVAVIANAHGLPPDLVTACLDDTGGEALALLLKALSLDAVQAQQVMLLASPLGYDAVAFRRVADLYSGMEPTVAESLVHRWATPLPTAPLPHQPSVADTTDRVRREATPRQGEQPAERRRAVGRA